MELCNMDLWNWLYLFAVGLWDCSRRDRAIS